MSTQGKLLYQQSRERLFQFSWRPRLPSLLPPERDAEILKNLKQYSKRHGGKDKALLMQDRVLLMLTQAAHAGQHAAAALLRACASMTMWMRYDEEDEALLMQADADVLQERQRMADEWKAFCDKRAEYVALLDGFKSSM
eukprot:1158752-Pelagomonas_calceolata.AAC.4